MPSFSHWNAEADTYDTLHRSMPPVGALVVWKMQERHPDDAFLAEVYPRLVQWHEWWMKARDGNHNGLLEWGSEQHLWQGAQYETGWDDNVAFQNTMLVGNTMNADAVDLSSLWSMDAEYLARIATALGNTEDAQKFETEHDAMNQRINDRLWNHELGIYCSRFWDIPYVESTAIDPATIFKAGFDVHFYADPGLMNEVAQRHDVRIEYSGQTQSSGECSGDGLERKGDRRDYRARLRHVPVSKLAEANTFGCQLTEARRKLDGRPPGTACRGSGSASGQDVSH